MSSDTIPDLIGTVEDPAIPFSSINVLKEYSVSDKAYKAFSRAPLSDELLDKFFRYGRFSFYHLPFLCSMDVRVDTDPEAEVGYESNELDTCTSAKPADGNQCHTDFNIQLIFWISAMHT
jgi:hypothetical protein